MFRCIVSLLVLVSLNAHAGGGRFTVELEPLGSFGTGIFDEGAAEIVDYEPFTRRAFVVNANDATVDVIDLSDPREPERVAQIDVSAFGAVANSLAVKWGLLAVAVEAEIAQDPGVVVFFSAFTLRQLATVTVGSLPDMVTFSPNGRYVLVANEGEPNEAYTVDPEGSITVIDLWRQRVRTADFTAFESQRAALEAAGVRIFGPGASVAQDLEPEFITIDSRSRHAWVTLQENNALAKVDLRRAEVTDILPLGFKDHRQPGAELDASDRDDAIAIRNWPVFGMYQPDSIASYRSRGRTYLVTANEGDARDFDGFSEEERVDDLTLDPAAFPDAAALQDEAALGRLQITTTRGDTDGDGDFDQLFAYGARSFSIWDEYGRLVFDSGREFEEITAALLPEDFNSDNDENDSFDTRSDAKGPEPEGVVVGKIRGRSYAFIGLERVGGIMVYDVPALTAPSSSTT